MCGPVEPNPLVLLFPKLPLASTEDTPVYLVSLARACTSRHLWASANRLSCICTHTSPALHNSYSRQVGGTETWPLCRQLVLPELLSKCLMQCCTLSANTEQQATQSPLRAGSKRPHHDVPLQEALSGAGSPGAAVQQVLRRGCCLEQPEKQQAGIRDCNDAPLPQGSLESCAALCVACSSASRELQLLQRPSLLVCSNVLPANILTGGPINKPVAAGPYLGALLPGAVWVSNEAAELLSPLAHIEAPVLPLGVLVLEALQALDHAHVAGQLLHNLQQAAVPTDWPGASALISGSLCQAGHAGQVCRATHA